MRFPAPRRHASRLLVLASPALTESLGAAQGKACHLDNKELMALPLPLQTGRASLTRPVQTGRAPHPAPPRAPQALSFVLSGHAASLTPY
jgi:hypothetical protein